MDHHLSKLTEIFCDSLQDTELKVISTKYAAVTILFSDSFIIDSTVKLNKNEIDQYVVHNKYPFWIFNKIIVLCIEYENVNELKASIAASALTTLLHKRKHLLLDEAKLSAREKISACTVFDSTKIGSAVDEKSSIYSCIDTLFPTDYHSTISMTGLIENRCTIEENSEDNLSIPVIAADRIAIDRIYRNRAQTQNHPSRNENKGKAKVDPTIVDGKELLLIGHNAEHYFFTQLQKVYGTENVTQTKNWRSSSRCASYPDSLERIDDSAGFDFELDDTLEKFAPRCKSTARHCYFEVKGINGSYNEEQTRFHISQNELELCQDIARSTLRQEKEAYFIVIIQNCLDHESISIVDKINW
jgi:hypothetical protein